MSRGPSPIYRLEFLTLSKLLSRADRLRLPLFQRGYVWDRDRAIALVDTLMRGMPIGSCILRARGGYFEVIDGQQRLSTLIGAHLGNGGDVPPLAVEHDPSAADDPLRRHGAHVRVVEGGGPGRVLLSALRTYNYAIRLAGNGHDPRDYPNDDHGDVPFRLGCTNTPAVRALADAASQLARAEFPALVFEHTATDAQVVEAFRRVNLGGVKMTAEQVAALTRRGCDSERWHAPRRGPRTERNQKAAPASAPMTAPATPAPTHHHHADG